MKDSDILFLSQLLITMREGVEKLEQAYKSRDAEHLEDIRKELIRLGENIDKSI